MLGWARASNRLKYNIAKQLMHVGRPRFMQVITRFNLNDSGDRTLPMINGQAPRPFTPQSCVAEERREIGLMAQS
jgi:hypothetical protein